MTSVVSNSSGRSGKPVRGKNQTSNSSGVSDSHNEKFQPTAEQMRYASLMTDKKDPDGDLKPKIDQIVELTGATRDDAAIALYDCDNDMAKAIEMILDGETLESEWQSTGKKKKQKNVAPTSTVGGMDSTSSAPINGQKNGDDRKFDKIRKDRNGASEENGSDKNLENGKPLRKKDPNFKPRERRFDGPGGREDRPPRTFQNQGETFSSEGEGFNGERRSGGFSGRGGRGGGLSGRGRGAPRGGRGGGRGGSIRNFGSRPGGPMNSEKPTDQVLGSIDTWTNEPKPEESSSVNTMTVGNWSDFNGQEWNENWNEAVQPVDNNKVFNISNDKSGPQPVTEQKTTAPAQMSFLSAASKSIEKEQQLQQQQQQQLQQQQQQLQKQQQQQQAQSTQQATSNVSYGSIASTQAKRNDSSSAVSQQSQSQQPSVPSQQQQQQQTQAPAVAAGRALLNQIQQQPQASVPSQMNQGFGGLNQYNKNATESIKSLVGLSASGALAESMQQPQQQDKQLNAAASRMNSTRTKAPESAVEMPASDISNLNLHFGSLDFGQNSGTNQQQQAAQSQQPPSFANISSQANQQESSNSIFEQGPPSVVQKSDKNISLMEGPVSNPAGFRGASAQSNQTKNVLSNLNDVLNSGNEKLNTSGNSYSSKKDYMMSSYKSSAYNDNYNSGAPGYNAPSQQSSQSNYSNYNANQASSFGNSASSGPNLMGSGANFNSSTYGSNTAGSVASVQTNKDNSGASQSSVNNASTTAATSSAPNSLGMMSNSTNTTNVLKNALPATGKGVHNIPPGVQQPFAQPLNIPPQFIMNNGVPVPYQPFYDLSQYNRDTYANYPSDMKINRGTEADFNPASSQAAGVVQSMAGQQAHNPGNFIPGLAPNMVPYFYGFPHGQYALNPSFYPQMPQTTVSNTAFGKNTGNSYTHSYNSGYDNIATGVAGGQTQEYGLKTNYSQQMQHNKPMQSGASNSDLGSGNTNGNGQSMYNKSHSQMNKNFDKQGGFQQGNQFLGGNNGLGYGNANAYMMQQPMINDQPGQTSGNQRPMKGNVGGPNQNYKQLWN